MTHIRNYVFYMRDIYNMCEWKTVIRDLILMIDTVENDTWNYFNNVHVFIDSTEKEILIEEQLRINIPVSNPYWCSILLQEDGFLFSSLVQNDEDDVYLKYDCTEEEFFQCSTLYNISELDLKTINDFKCLFQYINTKHFSTE